VRSFGSKGSGEGQFSGGTLHVALAPGANVYVSDRMAHRVLRFTREGEYVGCWGERGKGEAQLERPEAIAVDSQGTVYVADGGNDRICKFTADGTYLGQWGGRGPAGASAKDMPDGSLAVPKGIRFDRADFLYVVSAGIPVKSPAGGGSWRAGTRSSPRRGRAPIRWMWRWMGRGGCTCQRGAASWWRSTSRGRLTDRLESTRIVWRLLVSKGVD